VVRRTAVPALLTGAALPSAVLLVGAREVPVFAAVLLVIIATLCCAALARTPQLSLRAVIVTIGVVLLIAVAVGPVGSHDLWSYVEYGRILGRHGDSPYLYTPSNFPHDPFLHLAGWRHTPSVYGPAFSLFAAAGAIVAGHSVLIARLWHQLAAAAALGGALLLVWRRTRDPRAVAWLGLHPLVIVSVVNGGHNDLVVGFLLAAAVLALGDGHDARAGALAGLAALVKASAALGALGAVAWAWSRRSRRAALGVLGGMALVVAIGTIPFGLEPLATLGAHAGLVSRASVWQIARDLVPRGATDVRQDLRFLGAFAVVALATLVVGWRRRDRSPALPVGGALAAYEAAGPYVLPWYAAWSLPALAFRRDAPLARWAWWYGALVLVMYQLPRHGPIAGSELEHVAIGIVVPVVALVAFVAAARFGDEIREPATNSGEQQGDTAYHTGTWLDERLPTVEVGRNARQTR